MSVESPGWCNDWTVMPPLLLDCSWTLKSIPCMSQFHSPFTWIWLWHLFFYFADSQYQSYFPQSHRPLEMLLGKPLYLEVRLLNAHDPGLVLLVHFCVAYPRSGKAVWLILYNGCVLKTFRGKKIFSQSILILPKNTSLLIVLLTSD